MTAGIGSYRTLLADPRARAFTAAGLVARAPMSMTGLSLVLLVTAVTGSYGRAGVITGVAALTGACVAPVWGRAMDRVGQARVLLAAAVLSNTSLAVLALTVLLRLPLLVTLAAALGVGLGFSSAGSAVRARWSSRLSDPVLLGTANAWEAVLDEVVFIVGPVLATFLATTVHPALGVGACVLLGLVGALWLAVQRETQPPVRSSTVSGVTEAVLPVRVLAPVVLAALALGAMFGAMELVVVAFARGAGVLSYAGVMIMVWAFGSLIAGVLTGTVNWRTPAARRFRVSAVLLACSVVPLPFAGHPVLLTALLMVSGFFIAPTLIAVMAFVQSVVPAGRLTEALGWSSMGMAAGVAAGAAGVGLVVDAYGPQAGFVGVIAVAGLLILAALGVRTPPAESERPGASEAVSAGLAGPV